MSGNIQGNSSLQVIEAVTQFVGGTQAIWNSITIPIPAGLVVYAVDTTVVKMGDGETLYSALPTLFTINQIITLTASIATLTTDNTTNTAAITTIEGEITAINASIAALQISSNTTILANEIAALTTEYNTLSGEYTTMNTSLNTTIANLASLQTQVNNLNNATLLADINTLTNEYNTLNTEYTTLNGTVSSLQTTVNNLSATVTPIPGEITTINSEIATINTSLTNKPNYNQICQHGQNSASGTGTSITTSASFTATRNSVLQILVFGGSLYGDLTIGGALTVTGAALLGTNASYGAGGIQVFAAQYFANAGAAINMSVSMTGSPASPLGINLMYTAFPTS